MVNIQSRSLSPLSEDFLESSGSEELFNESDNEAPVLDFEGNGVTEEIPDGIYDDLVQVIIKQLLKRFILGIVNIS